MDVSKAGISGRLLGTSLLQDTGLGKGPSPQTKPNSTHGTSMASRTDGRGLTRLPSKSEKAVYRCLLEKMTRMRATRRKPTATSACSSQSGRPDCVSPRRSEHHTASRTTGQRGCQTPRTPPCDRFALGSTFLVCERGAGGDHLAIRCIEATAPILIQHSCPVSLSLDLPSLVDLLLTSRLQQTI